MAMLSPSRILSVLLSTALLGSAPCASYLASLSTASARSAGWDLSTRRPDAAVGIIAAQSIGEPGTQLTMRTIHSVVLQAQTILRRSSYRCSYVRRRHGNVNEGILGRS